MRTPAKCGAWLLPLLLTGCIFHKTRPAPIQSLAPPIGTSLPLEVASLELPPSILVIPAQPIYNLKVPTEPIKQPAKHRRPANKGAEETMEAAASPTPVVSAIGELSAGDPANFHQQTEDSIAAIERGLNGINRPLDDSEQKTADHIREFLKQAKAALASGDIDGAHTLAAKAKVLLDELTKT
jgi:hypothetical protein